MESNKVAEQLREHFQSIDTNEEVLTVSPGELIPLLYRLRDEFEFNYLTDETAVDSGDCFEVIYNLSRVPQGDILMVKTKVDKETAEVPSAFEVWPGAIWFEREIFDMLGIKFTNHPDLRRILLDDSFEGYPLRKDFQWVGGREV